MITTAYILFFGIHVIACAWIGLNFRHPNAWFVRAGYEKTSAFDIYVTSMYYTITTVTTIGYGDYSAFTTPEKAQMIIIQFVGICIFTIIQQRVLSVRGEKSLAMI